MLEGAYVKLLAIGVKCILDSSLTWNWFAPGCTTDCISYVEYVFMGLI